MSIVRRCIAALLLPFAVAAAGPAARPAAPVAARWSLAIDSRSAAGPWLSVAHGLVSCVRDAPVVAVDLRTGRIRGRSRVAVESRQRRRAATWDRADVIGNETVLLWSADGASVIALDAGNGDIAAATDGVEDYVGRDRRTLWFSVAGGGLKSLDLDTNRSLTVHNAIVRGAVRVEGRTAVAVIDGRLTAIALPSGAQTPLHVDGRWVGGPADGNIFIARDDGTYAQPLAGGKPVRLAVDTSQTRFLTATGRQAYFVTNAGGVVAADLASLAPTRTFKSACRFVEGVRITDVTAPVHCDDARMQSRLYAFDLPAPAP